MLLKAKLLLLVLALPLGLAAAQPKSAPRLAYEVYLGCLNQHLHSLEVSGVSEDLARELEGCRQLARRVLRDSKSPEAAQLVAHMLLLNTDGGESEQNNELAHSKARDLRKSIPLVRRLLEQGKCVAEGVKVPNPSRNLCAERPSAERRLSAWVK